MDYEKKYKNALERARICHKDMSNLDGVTANMAKDFFEEVFPELRESKDERIKKAIITLLNTTIKGKKVYSIADTTRSEMLTWLEKQGEKSQRMISAEAKEALYNKPAWSEEDERLIKISIACLSDFAAKGYENAVECIDWLKSLKSRVQPKKKWSEEDEKRLQSCLNILQAKGIMGVTETINTKWLKSLKERINYGSN